ncbi:hypothetical protein AMS68_006932 [Peltaster fructicola]|uniref:Amino acid permease/ SLC12A domain-containing protein n=1 Tax=Peltaster fructicola TaxID=286661 RepID=A0A6H0Y3A8_9PEZI|nr:hypothetical protein AMS68_006932 [Peltaster fructicola]
MDEYEKDDKGRSPYSQSADTSVVDVDINTSGHVQELDRTFGFWSICALGVVTDNAWGAGSGTLVVAFYNGGGPGVLYGLITATFFYGFIAACLAELASSMPTSANVYHWASVTAGPKYGRVTSFFAGWWNCLAWTFGTAAPCALGANAVIALWSIWHPEFEPERWQLFIVYLGIVFVVSSMILFGQPILARASTFFGATCMILLIVSFLTIVVMISNNGSGYASNYSVWQDFQNLTGWDSPGLVFLMGVLNGAFTIGTPDGACHMCEEVPRPRTNIPWGIFAQWSTGFLSTFAFYIVLLYGINDYDAIFATDVVSFPLAAIYRQATNSDAATTALLVIFIIDIIICITGAYMAAGRMLWTLARDNAVPGAGLVRRVNPIFRNPFNAQLIITFWLVVLGCIYIGSVTAFNAFVGVFCILATMSYMAAILPNLITARRYVPRGPFWMPARIAYPVMAVACAYTLVFNVLYMFPYVYPVDATTMNYSCVMAGGCTLLLIPWYLWKRTRGYVGPEVALDARDDIVKGLVGMSMAEEEQRRHRYTAR